MQTGWRKKGGKRRSSEGSPNSCTMSKICEVSIIFLWHHRSFEIVCLAKWWMCHMLQCYADHCACLNQVSTNPPGIIEQWNMFCLSSVVSWPFSAAVSACTDCKSVSRVMRMWPRSMPTQGKTTENICTLSVSCLYSWMLNAYISQSVS